MLDSCIVTDLSRNMLISLFIILLVQQMCLCVDLNYTVKEGRKPGTYVGDIVADSHLPDSVTSQDRNQIRFKQITTNQLFTVSETTGKLYTAKSVDTELMCTFNKECFKIVEVAVQKGSSYIKVLQIKVKLEDVNDNQPKFPVTQVSIEFSEKDSKGTKILIPNAIDNDVGDGNSQITYELIKKRNEPFILWISKSIDGTSKLFINLEEKLDREEKDTYLIQVVAKDGGTPTMQSMLDVHISVKDVNDNMPIFSQKAYNVSIKNEPSETSAIIIISANDLDSGLYGRITYHFTSKTSDIAKTHFKLNKVTGEIFLNKRFTLGQELTNKLYVEARDGGTPSLSSIALVLVNVINQQNTAPIIDVNFVSESLNFPENIKVGSFIAYVRVTDHDAGQNGKVSCVLYHDKFELQNYGIKRFKVILKKPLDREIDEYHDITITCQDKGTPRLHSESTFTIHVRDVSDVQPQFSRKIYKFSINENEKAKFPVGYINATDPDLGPGGKLTYSLISDNKYFLPFQISDSGLITTVMSLDHEFQDIYEFQILVKDKGTPPLNNTVNVNVEVRDENDNAPYFTFPSINPYTMNVVYHPHHTINITVIGALDRDSRENAFLKYEITSGNDKQLFVINQYTGLLSFTRVVTQYDAKTYELEFVVRDSGSPVLSATTTVILIITVSNKTSILPVPPKEETEENIQFDFLIAIVSVAVTVSVVITAIISICYIRYNDQRKDSQRSKTNFLTKCEQRQLMCPSYLAASCKDVPIVGSMDHCLERTRSSQCTNSRGGTHKENMDIVQKGIASGLDFHTASEVIYQEIGSGGKRGKKTAPMYPDCHRVISMLASHTESVEGWNSTNTTHSAESQDQYSSHYSLAHTPWIVDQNVVIKPMKQRFSCPVDTRMSPRCLHKSNNNSDVVDSSRPWPGLKPSKPWTLPESRRPVFDFPPLPTTSTVVATTTKTVAQVDYHRNVDQLMQLPLPKYYVLEQPSLEISPQIQCFDSPGEIEQALQLPLPKYYVLESGMQTPPSVLHSDDSEELEHLDDIVQLPLPKYYVLEPDSQNRPQVSHTNL